MCMWDHKGMRIPLGWCLNFGVRLGDNYVATMCDS